MEERDGGFVVPVKPVAEPLAVSSSRQVSPPAGGKWDGHLV